jgi:deoxyribonuclease-4
MIFGGHVSAAGGIEKTIERAKSQGFEVMQFFASSPRSYSFPAHSEFSIKEFNRLFKESSLKQHFFHAIYLLNLATSKPELLKISIQSLVDYLNFGDKIGSSGTIFHVGSSRERSFAEVAQQVVEAMQEVLARTPKSQPLIMESAAGAGNVVGQSLEELTVLFKAVNSKRLKLCLDTQHLWASGVNVADYDIFGSWLRRFDQEIGIGNLVCFHANDSKTELGSHRDRHENIGEGLIGKSGFRNILAQPLLKDKPFILEVPGANGTGPDRANLEIMRNLA